MGYTSVCMIELDDAVRETRFHTFKTQRLNSSFVCFISLNRNLGVILKNITLMKSIHTF